jgi:hypothetical protein
MFPASGGWSTHARDVFGLDIATQKRMGAFLPAVRLGAGVRNSLSPNDPKSADQELVTGSAWIEWLGGDKNNKGEEMSDDSSSAASSGIGFGCAMAIAISWSENHSILWAILHGLCSWLYVIYYAIWK